MVWRQLIKRMWFQLVADNPGVGEKVNGRNN